MSESILKQLNRAKNKGEAYRVLKKHSGDGDNLVICREGVEAFLIRVSEPQLQDVKREMKALISAIKTLEGSDDADWKFLMHSLLVMLQPQS